MTFNPHGDMMDMDRVAAALRSSAIGHTLDYHLRAESTMLLAHQLALRPDIPSGALVVAEEQTAGRGRLQRRWQAPPGRALLFSVVLKQGQLPRQPGHLPMLAGLAVLRALDSMELHGVRAGLKWPNDILLAHGPPPATSGKVAGILVESSMRGDRLEHAVLGIGINVNQTLAELPQVEPQVEPPAMPPTSLAVALGSPVDRTELLIQIAQALADLLTWPAPTVVANWRRALWTIGQQVTVYPGDGSAIAGRAVDVTEAGSLRVDVGGTVHTFDAGDVSLRGPE